MKRGSGRIKLLSSGESPSGGEGLQNRYKILTKTRKTPLGYLNPLSSTPDWVGSQLCPSENEFSRTHQPANQFLTKVKNFRFPIGKNTASLKNQEDADNNPAWTNVFK